ncbi:MAG: 3-deoxy-D-manno-octulosonic acid transferase [Bacteroidales bacterium]|nr:3-deoxy-D-manno-octulosonic acid transferase [Bacteroidales bacterium]
MKFLYNLGITAYTLSIRFASLFNSKAAMWVKGRRGWKKQIAGKFNAPDTVYWFHCASLGEFEQGRPVIELIKKRMPEVKILLTFFSPSGYEIRKNYENADLVMYLPADIPRNVRYFLKQASPAKAVFIKYEFWYNYLSELHRQSVPVYLVSGTFRPSQHFFRFTGRYFLKYLKQFTHFFVQDNESANVLQKAGISHVTVSGDTRFDRVYSISQSAAANSLLASFKASKKLIVAGSSWPPDEEIITRYINTGQTDAKWVFAPHEVDPAHINRLEKLLKVPVIKYSEAGNADLSGYVVLIIDSIGLLSSVYKYADISVIGGGFGKGIHNILEPATWGIPVVFGPNHNKFNEANELLKTGGAMTFGNYSRFESIINNFLTDQILLKESSEISLQYVKKNLGASQFVADKLI